MTTSSAEPAHATNGSDARLRAHAELASWFADRSDDELGDVIGRVDGTTGWGVSRTIDVHGNRVFVKCIPLTELERAHLGATGNLFALPATYHYGVGSAGFGAARELVSHVKTTRWVLEGLIPNFPLLHHHRLLPLPGQTRMMDSVQLERYIARWDGNQAIRQFIEARQQSGHSIVLFIEHIPHVLQTWLPLNQHAIDRVIHAALAITSFLRTHGIAHLDANPSNVLTDGERLYFADFGLMLDSEFDLADDERAFLANHRHFDIAEFLTMLSWPAPNQPVEHGPRYKQALSPYAAVVDAMSAVFRRLMTGPKSSAGYDDAEIERLLRDAVAKAQAPRGGARPQSN